MRAKMMPPMPTVDSATPRMSRVRGELSSRVSGTYSTMRRATRTPTGTLIQKAQRHV
jgi:hypothetical protein